MACNSITLSALDASCSNSVGGIQAVYLLPYSDFVALGINTGNTDGAIITGMTFMSGATVVTASTTDSDYKPWVEYKFRKNSGSMTSNLSLDEANGVSFIETDLVMTFSRMETRKRTEMVALAAGEVACVVKDSNGAYWFLGANEGVTASAGVGQTGQQKTDGNYYQVTLKDTATEYPYELEKAVGDALAKGASKDGQA